MSLLLPFTIYIVTYSYTCVCRKVGVYKEERKSGQRGSKSIPCDILDGVPIYTACIQNSISGSYMDAVFKLVVHEESEIWINRKIYYSSQVSRVCVPSV